MSQISFSRGDMIDILIINKKMKNILSSCDNPKKTEQRLKTKLLMP